MSKFTAFRGWVSVSDAKRRAFLGWFKSSVVAAPPTTVLRPIPPNSKRAKRLLVPPGTVVARSEKYTAALIKRRLG